MVVFSLLIGLGLLTSDLDKLTTFDVPEHLLALLGLSNVVYIGGKAVTPNTKNDLDKKLDALRDAESALAKVLKDVDDKDKLGRAKASNEYHVYISAAREAARMLKSLYGKEGTEFKDEPIEDDQLMPRFLKTK